MKKAVVFITLYLFVFLSYGQKSVEKNLAVADAYLQVEEYANAIEYFKRVYNRKKTAATATHIASCFYAISEYKNAVKWFEIAEDHNFFTTQEIIEFASSYKSISEYNKARNIINRFLILDIDL